MKDYPIGAHFVFDATEYVVTKELNNDCGLCDFAPKCVFDETHDILCIGKYRMDKTDVVFEQVFG